MFRSDKVYECVKTHTEHLLKDGLIDAEGADATYVSDRLKIERSNVSRELNQLWKDGKLIKFQGRPVFFMDYLSIRNAYPGVYIPLLIPYGKKISSYLSERKPDTLQKNRADPLKKIVGAQNGTLSSLTDDVISSISYKTHSLPVLLKGDKGLRKRSFVTAIFEHAKANGIKPEDSRLVLVNCQEYQDTGDGFLKRIFGYGEEKGAFELANKGIVFLQNIHTLPLNLITPITDALTFGYYSKMGEIRRRKLEVSLIASVNRSATETQLDFYKGVFPMIVELPSFNHRNIYEKIEIVLSVFTDEAVSLNTNIILNKSVLSVFLQHYYEENERQLVNYVRITCANALRYQNSRLENTLHINLENLPLDLLSSKIDYKGDAFLIGALDMFEKDYLLCESNGRCEAFDFFGSIQNRYNEKNLEDFSRQFYLDGSRIADMDKYVDESLEAILRCDDSHYHKLRSKVSDPVRLVFLKEIFSEPHYSKLSENSRALYSVMATVSDYLLNKPVLPEKESEDKQSIDYKTADRICEQLFINSLVVRSYICRYLKKAVEHFEHQNAQILLVCRGESIASQYKEICGKYADEKNIRIDAIDCLESLQYNDVLELIYSKVSHINNDSGVLIITDSVSFLDIENDIEEKTGINCRIVSPLSFELIIRCIDELSKPVPLDDLNIGTKLVSHKNQKMETEEDFINRFCEDVLSKTLTHINPKKAVDVLLESLDEILDELKIIKSRDIVVKYLSHGVHMLERIIKHQPLNYYHLSRFSAENHELMDVIAKSLSAAENTFDLSVPSCEIAYLAEIFLEGVK